MRELFLVAAFIGILVSTPIDVFAQGTFSFANSAASLITSNGTSAGVRGLRVAMYYSLGTNLNVPVSSFMLNTDAVTTISPLLRGRFSGGVRTVPGVQPGSFVVARICAWETNYHFWQPAWFFGLCGQYVFKGSSSAFLVGPLGDGAMAEPALLTNMPTFSAGVSLAPELCAPIVKVIAEPPTFRLRIDLNGSSISFTRIRIEGSSTMESNTWQVLTDFYPAAATVYWTDPGWTNASPRFYRVRAAWN